jgi:hypothetical protein
LASTASSHTAPAEETRSFKANERSLSPPRSPLAQAPHSRWSSGRPRRHNGRYRHGRAECLRRARRRRLATSRRTTVPASTSLMVTASSRSTGAGTGAWAPGRQRVRLRRRARRHHEACDATTFVATALPIESSRNAAGSGSLGGPIQPRSAVRPGAVVGTGAATAPNAATAAMAICEMTGPGKGVRATASRQ